MFKPELRHYIEIWMVQLKSNSCISTPPWAHKHHSHKYIWFFNTQAIRILHLAISHSTHILVLNCQWLFFGQFTPRTCKLGGESVPVHPGPCTLGGKSVPVHPNPCTLGGKSVPVHQGSCTLGTLVVTACQHPKGPVYAWLEENASSPKAVYAW